VSVKVWGGYGGKESLLDLGNVVDVSIGMYIIKNYIHICRQAPEKKTSEAKSDLSTPTRGTHDV